MSEICTLVRRHSYHHSYHICICCLIIVIDFNILFYFIIIILMYFDYLNGAQIKLSRLYYMSVIQWEVIHLAKVVNHIMLTTKLHLFRKPRHDPLER